MSLNVQRLSKNLNDYAQSVGRSGHIVSEHWNEVHKQWRGLVNCLDAEWIRELQPIMEKTGDFFGSYTDVAGRLEEHLRQSAEKIRQIDN